MIKTVRECDYCQNQTTADDILRPERLPAGWRSFTVIERDEDGGTLSERRIEVCDVHSGATLGNILATTLS